MGKKTVTGIAAVTTKTGKGFFFELGRQGNDAYLRFQSQKAEGRGAAQAPDYRRYTGAEREILREFLGRRQERGRTVFVAFDGYEDDPLTLINPDDRIIEDALKAGFLRSPQGKLLRRAEGLFRYTLTIRDDSSGIVVLEPTLRDGDGQSAEAEGEGTEKAEKVEKIEKVPVSPRLVMDDHLVYPVEDLGFRWAEIGRLRARVARTDLPAFLSLAFSRFGNLELSYEGWTTRRIRPAAALPALLFMEIDPYGYLHVRPISFLRGFPPLFLEKEEILTVVEMDEAAKTFGVAEVVFPESPEDLFRNMLTRGNKALAKTQIHEEQGRFIIAPEFAGKFFGESIIELSQRFILLETQVLSGYKLRFSKPKVRFSLGSGIDYLSGSAEVEIDGEMFSFSHFLDEYRKCSFITLADGTRSFPDQGTMNRLNRLVSKIKPGEKVEFSYFDIPLLLQDDAIEVDGAAWESARPFFTGYNTIKDRPGAWPLAEGILRPYQEFGVRWLDYLREYRMGACLADEMGLGKTIQVIALLRRLYREGETGYCLILCPKTLVFNWTAELKRFAPELPRLVHYGAARDASRLQPAKDEVKNFKIILSTYATLRRDVEDFQNLQFLYVILDESQNIKNLTTQTTAAVLSLNSRHRLAMSGTPVENNLSDLYSLFRFLNPGFFGSEKLFVERYLKPIQEGGDEDALKDLKARIYPFILRRLKRDVLKDLPDKSEETAYIELDEVHLALYHERRRHYKQVIDGIIADGEVGKSSMLIFKALSELRRLASVPEAEGEYAGPSAKRLYLKDMIAELVDNGHKCLIFTNFLAHVELVSHDLADMGIPNLTMTGATVDRQTLVNRFQSDRDVKAFIMTLKTGGTGLNLTAADYIFILDPWWNRAAESQAIDRSHRIGQVNPVFCYRLIARDTIEERILELQQRKTDLAGALLSDDAGSLKSLSPDDIAYLVGEQYE